jgi:hypothetical protein
MIKFINEKKKMEKDFMKENNGFYGITLAFLKMI